MNSHKISVRRSFIFTPGLKPEMFPKAISSGADMVCIELEDGIAIKDKDEARKNTFKALETLEVKSGVELVVRVNCQRTKFGLMDLEAVVSSKTNVKAIMLPKVKTPDEITFIDDMLTDCGLDTDLHVIMETNEALESIYDIAHASKRIVALYFGGVDMAAELRVPNEYKNLIYARSRLVHAGASVGVDVIDVPYLDLEDMDGMKKEAELVRDLGFTGKGSIHPKQINSLNEIFTPSKEEIINDIYNQKSISIAGCNVNTAVRSYFDKNLNTVINSHDYRIPDGYPLTWPINISSQKNFSRLAGADIFDSLIENDKSLKHFFIGGTEEVLEKMSRNIRKINDDFQICGLFSPPFSPLDDWDMSKIAEQILDSKADMLWIGLGFPKQEIFMQKN